MPTKGTINLGFIKAIHSGVNPPLNKKMIWYDENEFAHKVWDVITETWGYLKINSEQFDDKANKNSSNLTEEDILSWREKLELFTKDESLEKFMQIQNFITNDGKIREDKIEGLNSKQDKLSSYDESILIENDGNIENNVSLFEEYFEQQECELNFEPIQIVAVYQDGIKLSNSEYEIISPKKIKIKEYVDENIQIEYTHLKS